MATRVIHFQVTSPTGTALATGNGQGYFPSPTFVSPPTLTAVIATLVTASSFGTPTIQITNTGSTQTGTQAMLSTPCTIDANELSSATAAVPAVIDTSSGHNAIQANDVIRIDITAAGTGAKGLMLDLVLNTNQTDIGPSTTLQDDGTGNVAFFIPTAKTYGFYINSALMLSLGAGGIVSATKQLYPGAEAGGQQTTGGWLHSTGVPNNANGNNTDWCMSDNGHIYFKTAGAWVSKV